MDKFRNVNYPYATPNDTFFARGLHLNMIVDEVNRWSVGVTSEIETTGVTDIVLGNSKDIDAAFINYKYSFPGSPGIGGNFDQAGELVVNNSSEHPLNQDLSWTRESVDHTGGSEDDVVIEFLVVGNDLVLRVTNNGLYDMEFMYSVKFMHYAS